MKNKIAPLFENVAESTAACLITMVQGNLLALGLGHWIIASRTGVIAGLIATMTLLLSRGWNRWVVAGVLAVATGAVDFFVHPGGFGAVATEAIVTGLAAGALSLIIGRLIRAVRRPADAGSAARRGSGAS